MKIYFEGYEEIELEESCSVLDLAIAHDIPLNHSCGGFATCGTCQVNVASNLEDLPPRNNIEQELAEDRDFKPSERLACQLKCFDGLKISIPSED